jgi:hypothetical protein
MIHLIVLTLSLFLAAAPAMALQANGCPDFAPPVVNVNQLSVAPRLNDTFDLAGLRQLATENKKEFSSTRHETPVGLTSASLKLDSHFEISVRTTQGDPLVCAQISALNLDFGFDDTTVYLARELPNGSCSYQTVLDHERRHIAVDQGIVAEAAPQMAALLGQAIAQIGVIRASSGATAEKQINALINQYLHDLGTSLSVIRQKRQEIIDAPEEYERLSGACDGMLERVIHNSRNGPAQ